MEKDFWLQKWKQGEIGFHKSEVNALLIKHFDRLFVGHGSRIFLPLCGKTLDIAWLLRHGHRVVGAELSSVAIDDLFTELGIKPQRSQVGKLTLYSADNIDVFVGDIFNLSADILAAVDAIYDRAALVALSADQRRQYAAHLVTITHAAPQLLSCFEYEQQQMEGPPFSIDEAEVKLHYGTTYVLQVVDRQVVPGGLKGIVPAIETVWLLRQG
jgi:thiopurine S-methyltransferase